MPYYLIKVKLITDKYLVYGDLLHKSLHLSPEDPDNRLTFSDSKGINIKS